MWNLALVLAVAAEAASSEALASRRATCTVLGVASPQASETRRQFSATRVIDLEFVLSTRRGAALPLALKVFTPNGYLYETLLPQLVPSSQGRGGERGRLTARLPVAGTAILTSSLYGRWSVVPYLQGDVDACGPPLAFWIGP